MAWSLTRWTFILERTHKVDKIKVAKSTDLLYRAEPFLVRLHKFVMGQYKHDRSKMLLSQQKHAIHFVNTKTCFENTKELFNSQKMLNIYKLNVLNTQIFMHKTYSETAPATFFKLFQKISHPDSTVFSELCHKISKINLTKSKYRVSRRGVLIWNAFLSHCE